jgi:hypothetical protein
MASSLTGSDRTAAVLDDERRPLQLSLFGPPVLCCSCHRLKDRSGRWLRRRVEHDWFPETVFSHGICPACKRRYYPSTSKRGSRVAAGPLVRLQP